MAASVRETPICFLVQDVLQEVAEVRSFRFHFGLSRLAFSPGQFLVTDHPHAPGLQAPITLSTSPAENSFELTVKRTGNFGTRFYDTVGIGDMIRFAPPQGRSLLEPAKAGPFVFVARDYCVTAARCLLRVLSAQPTGHPFILIHELSDPSAQLFGQEFTAAHGSAGFQYLPLPANPAPDWTGARGEFSADLLAALFPDWLSYTFQLCGEAEDVGRYKSILRGAGLPSAQTGLERWS